MFCRYCGKELDDSVAVCPECGKPTESVVETAAEQQATKPKKKWKLIVGICAAVVALAALAVILLLAMGVKFLPKANDIYKKDSYSVTSDVAAEKSDVVVATVNDKKLTNGELQIYYWMQVYEFANYYGSYLSYVGLDMEVPLDSQKCAYDETMTWQQYFLDVAVKTWQRYQLLCELAAEAGYVLPEEEQESLDAVPESLKTMAEGYGYASVDELLQDDMGPGCNEAGYLKYIETCTVAVSYYNSIYDSLTPTDDQVEAYFDEHAADFEASGITKESGLVADVRHILVAIEGGTTDEGGTTTYTDADWEACYAEAEAILNEWKAGEATEESFAALVAAHTDDTGSASTGGLYEGITATSSYVEEFRAWAVDMSRQSGDTGIVKTQFGYHIMYFVDGEPEWKTSATSQYMAEQLDNMIAEAEEKWPTKINFNKIALTERVTDELDETTAAAGTDAAPETTAATVETEDAVVTEPVDETGPLDDTVPADTAEATEDVDITEATE